MKKIPISEAKLYIATVAGKVARHKDRVVITKHGRRIMAWVSLQDLELLEQFDKSKKEKH